MMPISPIDLIEAVQQNGGSLRLDADGRIKLAGPKAAFPSDLMARLREQKEALAAFLADAGRGTERIPPAPTADSYPLSSQQRSLWLTESMGRKDGGDYNMIAALDLAGPVSEAALAAAFQALLRRHESLRTAFELQDGEPVQRVVACSLPVERLADNDGADAAQTAHALAASLFATRFDLSRPPLLRVCLQRIGADRHVLVICLHHIVADGWSMGVLFRDLAAFYRAALTERAPAPPPLDLQYKDYAHWQSEQQRQQPSRGLAWWLDVLDGVPDVLDPPADFGRQDAAACASLTRLFSAAEIAALDDVVGQVGTTRFVAVLTAYQMVLARFAGTDDLVVGVPSANRGVRSELEDLIGHFANTLPMRLHLDADEDGIAVLRRNDRHIRDCWQHPDTPLEAIVDALKPRRLPGRPPLVQAALGFQNAPVSLDFGDLAVRAIPLEEATAKFHLTLQIFPREDGLEAFLEYRSDLYAPETAAMLLDGLCQEPLRWSSGSAASRDENATPRDGPSVRWQRFKRALGLPRDAILCHGGDSRLTTLLGLDAASNRQFGTDGALPENSWLIALGNDDPLLAKASEAARVVCVGGWSFSAPPLPLAVDFVLASAEDGPLAVSRGVPQDAHRRRLACRLIADGRPHPVRSAAIGAVGALGTARLLARRMDGKGRLWAIEEPDRFEGQLWNRGRLFDLASEAARLRDELGLFECALFTAVSRLVCCYVPSDHSTSPASEEIVHRLSDLGRQTVAIALCRLPRLRDGRVDIPTLIRTGLCAPGLDPLADEPLEGTLVYRAKRFPQPPLHLWEVGLAPSKAGATEKATPATALPAVPVSSTAPPSLLAGPPLAFPDDFPATLPGQFARAAQGDGALIQIDQTGGEGRLSYARLRQRALSVLAALQQRGLTPGDRLLLLTGNPIDFFTAFWACLCGGLIACPFPAPKSTAADDGDLQRMARIAKRIGAAAVLCPQGPDPEGLHRPDPAASHGRGLDKPWFAIPDLVAEQAGPAAGHQAAGHQAAPNDVALLLFTSGSTGLPKAVMLSHANLLAMAEGLRQRYGFTEHDSILNWMPLEHVGVLGMLSSVAWVTGASQVHVDTAHVLADPLRWLDLLDRYKAGHAWAPHFAFALIGDLAEQARGRDWDLSRLKCLLNGGEAVVAGGLARFLAVTAPHGLGHAAIAPSWGMSETSSSFLLRQGLDPQALAADPYAIVGVGTPHPGAEARLVGEDGRPVPLGEEGRLEVRGPQVNLGYWGDAQATAASRDGQGWFRTGDRARFETAGLEPTGAVITGRDKEVIVVKGQNYSQQALESALEELQDITTTCVAAVGVPDRHDGAERLAVFFHSPLQGQALARQGLAAMRDKLRRGFGLLPDYFIPLAEDEFPKTAIGKIQRKALRQGFIQRRYDRRIVNIDKLEANNRTLPDWFAVPTWRRRQSTHSQRGRRFLDYSESACLDLTDDDVLVLPISEPDAGTIHRLCTTLARTTARVGVALPGNPEASAADAVATPMGRALAMALRSLIQETPSLALRVLHAPADQMAGSGWQDAMASMAYADHATADRMEAVLHAGGLWFPGLRRLSPVEAAGPLPVPDDGFALITGGLGSLGPLLARHLLRRHGVPVLLCGRRPRDEAAMLLEDLERDAPCPAGVDYVRVADLCERQQVETALDHGSELFGMPPRTILHLAGRTDVGIPAIEETAQSIAGHLDCKLTAAKLLRAALTERGGGLFAAFSSVNGQFGGFGASAYSAANAALDRQCQAWAAEGGPVTSVSLAWSLWRQTESSPGDEAIRRRGYIGLTPDPALTSFEVALRAAKRHGLGHVLIGVDHGHGTMARLGLGPQILSQQAIQVIEAEDRQPGTYRDVFGDRVRVDISRVESIPRLADGTVDHQSLYSSIDGTSQTPSPDTAPRSELEKRVAAIWAAVLGRAAPGVTENFFDAGGNSLTLAKLQDRLARDLGSDIKLADLFQYPTVRAQATLIGARTGNAAAARGDGAARRDKRRAALQRGRPAL